jgi:hypothetical protein
VSGALKLGARFLVRSALAFCLIVLVLLLGRWVLSEWRAFDAVARDLAVLQAGEQALGAERAGLVAEVASRANGLRQAPAQVLDARIAAIGKEIATLALVAEPPTLTFPLPTGSTLAQGLVTRTRNKLALELLVQERDYLLALRTALDRGQARSRLAVLHASHVAAYEALNKNLRAQSGLRVHHLLASYVPGTREFRQRQQLELAETALLRTNNAAAAAVQSQQRALHLLQAPAASLAFVVNQGRVDAAMGQLRSSISDGAAYTARNWLGRMADAVREVAVTAGLILLGLILLPLAIKTVFYYVLAPLAERRPAFIVDPGASGLLDAAPGNRSAPSTVITLEEGEEMLIQPACIQSAAVTVRSGTRWLLDWESPFTCLAAGLFALTRIVSSKSAAIVVSPAQDPLAEIALLRLPQGSSMVFQPRALVGIVHRDGERLRMARQWRLGSLHAWLTLQLRYLVFRGPVTLIVKGCRGVRVDAIDQGRVISQSATLGFSANAAYATSRCQTFLPYLTGRAPLLNDRFDGDPGFCVYEEALPSGAGKGIVGRGLEGVTDALLKVFGL